MLTVIVFDIVLSYSTFTWFSYEKQNHINLSAIKDSSKKVPFGMGTDNTYIISIELC